MSFVKVLGMGLFSTTMVALGAMAADIKGVASIVDGDTVEIHGQRIRFHGIDAPESTQLCQRDGKPWRCGQGAANALADFLGRRTVSCEPLKTDRYNRTVGRCTVGGQDVEAWMVSNGWAVAYRQYSKEYIQQEDAARKAKAGIWASEFQMPFEWRRENKDGRSDKASEKSKSAACSIKGNISASGERIYHVPGGDAYKVTRIDPDKGEKTFCSEVEALAAGWRKSER